MDAEMKFTVGQHVRLIIDGREGVIDSIREHFDYPYMVRFGENEPHVSFCPFRADELAASAAPFLTPLYDTPALPGGAPTGPMTKDVYVAWVVSEAPLRGFNPRQYLPPGMQMPVSIVDSEGTYPGVVRAIDLKRNPVGYQIETENGVKAWYTPDEFAFAGEPTRFIQSAVAVGLPYLALSTLVLGLLDIVADAPKQLPKLGDYQRIHGDFAETIYAAETRHWELAQRIQSLVTQAIAPVVIVSEQEA